MENPKVCVIMPVYNGEATIKLALQSLLVQSYAEWECVIVNDGSTDGTKFFLDSLNDKRFKIIHLDKNTGRGFARQTGLDNAAGKYLAYLDADDFYHKDKLKKQVEFLENNPSIDLVATQLLTFNSKFYPTTMRVTQKTSVPVHFKFGNELSISMATAMIRLPKAKTIKYNAKLNATEDIDYFTKYLDGGIYFNIPDIMYYYLVSDETTTYRKILQFTLDDIKRGWYVFKRKKSYSLLIIGKTSIKWIIYICFIPLLGVNFFLWKRGVAPSQDEINNFEQQLITLTTNETINQ